MPTLPHTPTGVIRGRRGRGIRRFVRQTALRQSGSDLSCATPRFNSISARLAARAGPLTGDVARHSLPWDGVPSSQAWCSRWCPLRASGSDSVSVSSSGRQLAASRTDGSARVPTLQRRVDGPEDSVARVLRPRERLDDASPSGAALAAPCLLAAVQTPTGNKTAKLMVASSDHYRTCWRRVS